jgi:Mg2+ and Co2+ transporter CorA
MPAKKSSKRKKEKIKSPGLSGWIIIFLTVFIAVFLVSVFLPKSKVGVSKTAPDVIRLQILNGCGITGAAEEMAQALIESSTEVFFDIIDKANAEVYNFEKTLVLDRRGNPDQAGGFSEAALYVAQLLDSQKDQLLIQKLADNLLDIEVTVIIGADYRSVIKKIRNEVN